MTSKISLCGLDCSICPAFIAYKTNDQSLRIATAKKWAEEYHAPDIKPEEINCTGCLSTKKPIYKHCLECGIRLCGLIKKVTNCGQCVDYDTCPKIVGLHKLVPHAKPACDAIRKLRK